MNRWLLPAGLAIIAGLLASLLIVALGLARRGVRVQLAEPIRISGPLAIGGNITVQEPITVTMDAMEIRVPHGVSVALPSTPLAVQATLGVPCPHCEEGVLLPVRWNLFTGEIRWQCTACGRP